MAELRAKVATMAATRRTRHQATVATALGHSQLTVLRWVVLSVLLVLLAVITAAAFLASYSAQMSFATEQIGWPDELRWIPPLLNDAWITVGILLVIFLALSGHPWSLGALYGRLLVATGTLASLVVNLAEYPDTGWASRIVAGAPPVAAFFAVEAAVFALRYLLMDMAMVARLEAVTTKVTRVASDQLHRLPGRSAPAPEVEPPSEPAPPVLAPTRPLALVAAPSNGNGHAPQPGASAAIQRKHDGPLATKQRALSAAEVARLDQVRAALPEAQRTARRIHNRWAAEAAPGEQVPPYKVLLQHLRGGT